MKRIILFTFFLIPVFVFAQTLDWIQTVESSDMGASGYDQFDISANEFGEVLVMGPFENIAYYNNPFGTIKTRIYSELGEVTFTETYGGKGRIIDMVSHGDFFYVVGEFLDSIQFPGFPVLSVEPDVSIGNFLLKLNRNGEVEWVQESLDDMPQMKVYSVDIHSDGSIFLGAGDFSGMSKIIQMNESGEVTDTWTQNNIGLISSVSVNEAGGVSIAGSCAHEELDFNGTIVQNPIIDYNIYVAHYNADGEHQWSHFMLDVTCPSPKVLLKDDGTTYFAGDLNISSTLGDFDMHPLGWVYSFFIAQISEVGEVLWAYQPEQPEVGLGDAFLASGHPIIDWGDGMMIGGLTRGSLVWDEGLESDSEIPGESLFMSHFHGDGQVGNLIYGDESNYGQTVLSMSNGPDGSLYMLGMVYDTLNIQGQSFPEEDFQLFISRWDSGIVQSVGDQISGYDLRHYPDPANDSFLIEGAFDGDRVMVYDILGRPVNSFTMNGSKRFDVSEFPAGTYILQVFRKDIPIYRSSIRVIH